MERKKVINKIEIIRMRTPEEKIDYLIIQFALLKITLEGKIKNLQKQIKNLQTNKKRRQ